MRIFSLRMDTRRPFGACLSAVRRQKGFTQSQLADAARVRQTYVSDLECGRNRNPSWAVVKRIADALGVRPEDIFPVPPASEAV